MRRRFRGFEGFVSMVSEIIREREAGSRGEERKAAGKMVKKRGCCNKKGNAGGKVYCCRIASGPLCEASGGKLRCRVAYLSPRHERITPTPNPCCYPHSAKSALQQPSSRPPSPCTRQICLLSSSSDAAGYAVAFQVASTPPSFSLPSNPP